MTDQLRFTLRPDKHSAAVARGVFALPYLRRVKEFQHAPPRSTANELYNFARQLWEKNHVGLAKGSEAYTRTHFLDPLLSQLGWHFIPELTQTRHKRPDYWLFVEERLRIEAAAADLPAQRFALSSSVLEAKQFTHPLDAVSKTETPGQFPSQQVQGYLDAARDPTGERYFQWAILTNGRRWRLYTQRAAADAYFEFTLADEHSFCTRDEFTLFVTLFTPAAFAQDATGRCALDDIHQQSLSLQAELEGNLRVRVFDVLEELATAFAQHKPNSITDADLQNGRLYDACLVFLYRLLFVLYAESRDLLPVRPYPPNSNKFYREKFSLQRLVEPLRQITTQFTSSAFTELYEDILKLFHLINGDNEQLNNECDVTRYNGGLFSHDNEPSQLIEQWRIPDPALARVLRQLIFAQPPARTVSKQQRIFTKEAIDYSTLEVRQLGDIYEGLLGGQLQKKDANLILTDENGENHRHGIYYTPDWVVSYLVRATLDPLLDRIENSDEVKKARSAKSNEERWCDAFAHGTLALNLVDPAMGSGHFLVRATEYLGEHIVHHPTTRRKTERIVTSGDHRRTKEEIERGGLIPVHVGLSQEEAEIAYWRRRVVEACIYGVDVNPMAVELAKLSLWLTCIAIDEPLNFLDHHLRQGNSLLFASAAELSRPPAPRGDLTPLQLRDVVAPALREVIRSNVGIEAEASTRMDLVKKKERMWRDARVQLQPLLRVADLWIAAVAELPIPDLDYLSVAKLELASTTVTPAERQPAEALRESLREPREEVQSVLRPFHWEIEFPDVFFKTDGTAMPAGEAGFDAVLGNPPYVSTQTSSGQRWLPTLQQRWDFSNDLYVFFVELGFRILRDGGRFGFIVSDTFFTLNSKMDMRQRLQGYQLDMLGQCDPFDATVDAAIFVAQKNETPPEHQTLFVQARFRWRDDRTRSTPDKVLPLLPDQRLGWNARTAAGSYVIEHDTFGDLRLHRGPAKIWRDAHKISFFEPQPGTLRLYERFNKTVKTLHTKWWGRIETSEKFSKNREALAAYQSSLQPGDVTLVGLIAEGGQGMRTANNARFLGYLEDTPQAAAILERRASWTKRWLADAEIGPRFRALLSVAGGDFTKPLKEGASWEATVEPLRAEFPARRLGFSKTDLYRVVPRSLVANEGDFAFAWQERKKELWQRWKESGELTDFWTTKPPEAVGDEEFCKVCRELQNWIAAENVRRKKTGEPIISRDTPGLRSAENYNNAKDAPRIATVYSGLRGHGQWVSFRKGDPEGNRWIDNEPLFIDWSSANVIFLFENSGRPEPRMPVVRNAHLYFTKGVTYTLLGNHVALKAKLQDRCVFDAGASRLTPIVAAISSNALLTIFNSDVFSFYLKKFLKNTAAFEISDLRMMPLVVPTPAQSNRLESLAELAIQAKSLAFIGKPPGNALVAECRELGEQLEHAPVYLRAGAQAVTYQKPDDCLRVIEQFVNWEAEKLYGVEGLGPFDEF